MTQYIDKDSVVAKIRCILNSAEAYLKYHHDDKNRLVYSYKHQILTMCELLSFLDTLEVKEVDLEKEINLWVEDNTCRGYCSADIRETAEHFFELGLKTKGGEK